MTMLPELPALTRVAPPAPPDGPSRAMAAGRARRRKVALPVLSALAVGVAAFSAQAVAGHAPRASQAAGSAELPPAYLAASTVRSFVTGPLHLELRSVPDGRLLREVPQEADGGTITSTYAVGAGDVFDVRRPRPPGSEFPLCGGELVRIAAADGAETPVLTVPADRAITALAVSASARMLAYALMDCHNETMVDTNVALHVRDLQTGQDTVGVRSDGQVMAMAWGRDEHALFLVGGGTVAWGGSDARVVSTDDLAGTRAVAHAATGCGFRGAAWGADGLYTVNSCGTFKNDSQTLQRFSEDGSPAGEVSLPACSLGAGVTADAETGHVLVWVNSTGECAPMNRLMYLRNGRLVDLATPSSDRLWAASW
jgi:hypothetical protein